MSEGSAEAAIPQSSLPLGPLEALVRTVVDQDRKNNVCEAAVSFQEEA